MLPQISRAKDRAAVGRRFLRVARHGLVIFSIATALAATGCRKEAADLRTSVPADALVYLETKDLGRSLEALTLSSAFRDASKNAPDLSALRGMQMAIAVTGFETTEKQVTEENSVVNFKPRFVAIAETNAWNWQANGFTENRIGEFVNDAYGGEVELAVTEKNGGKSYVWTATDGRKAYAFVLNGRIFFGNDESAIEKCLSVARGEGESLVTNDSTVRAHTGGEDELAFGFISTDGVAQIANVAGVSAAMTATEDEEGRSFIARILPEILRGSVREISWSAVKTPNGIEDRYLVTLEKEVASVFNETIKGNGGDISDLAAFLPTDVHSATRYDLSNPQIAWRSVLLTTAKKTDAVAGQILFRFSNSLFDPYGIADAEKFLGAVGGQIMTARLDADGEKNVAVATLRNADLAKASITEVDFRKPPVKQSGADLWKSEDGEIGVAIVGDKMLLGESDSVLKCLEALTNGQNFTRNQFFVAFTEKRAPAVTLGKDADTAEKVVEVMAEKKAENIRVATNYLTETRFSEKGMERKSISPFGFIGALVEQFASK